MGEDPVAAQLCRAYAQYRKACVGIKEVSPADIVKYSSMKLDHLSGNLYNITDMIEKPAPGQEFSLFSILGRCLLKPETVSYTHLYPAAAAKARLKKLCGHAARSPGCRSATKKMCIRDSCKTYYEHNTKTPRLEMTRSLFY